ncbi:MAG: methyl-accepting chemotaxis protein [Chloroflexota bacterium]
MEKIKGLNLKFGKNQTSLLFRLARAFALLALGTVLLVGVIAYFQSRAALETAITVRIASNAEATELYVNEWIRQRKVELETLAGMSVIRSLDPVTAQEAITQYAEQWNWYETLFVTGIDGITVAHSEGNSSLNVSDRSYFMAAMQGQTVVSEPLISRTTGNVIMVVATPLYDSNDSTKVIGMVAGSLPTSAFQAVLENAWVGNSGDAYLINKAGYLITPPRFSDEMKKAGLFKERPELEVKVQTAAAERLLRSEHGVDKYTNSLGIPVIGSFMPLETGWGLIVEQDVAEANAPVNQLRNIILLVGVGVLALAVIIGVVLARNLANPIKAMAQTARGLALGDIHQEVTYTSRDEVGVLADSFRALIGYQRDMARAAEQIAEGDLTVNVQPVSEKDVLGHSFARMIARLRQQVDQLQNSALSLKAAAAQLAAASSQAGQATSQIAATVQQVAAGVGQQTESVGRTANVMDQMAHTIDGVARGAQEQAQAAARATQLSGQLHQAIQQVAAIARSVSEGAAAASKVAAHGQDTVRHTVEGMQSIREKVDLSAEKIAEMSNRSNQIGVIVETIEDIASQTNLLALNAAIEAARAGEHGKGFAVVADEVRKLAERSANATREIGALIKAIQTSVSETVNAMLESAQEVEKGVESAGEAGNALQQILQTVEQVNQQAKEAARAAVEMEKAANEMIAAVDSVSAVIEENTAATEQMSASSTEVTMSIETIASVSEQNSAAIEEVSASAEEMSAQVEEVSASAHSLAEMADVLEKVVVQFKL